MTLSQALIADFKEEAANTRKVLAAVPDDRFDWKPHAKSMSLGQLAGHLAEMPIWVRSMMEAELDFAAAAGDYKPFLPQDKAALLTAFDKNAKILEKTLDGKDDAFMKATWTMRAGDKVLMQAPRHAAIRSTAIHHAIHHRGQLTVFLRLLDVPVPGTYGPTADEPSFG